MKTFSKAKQIFNKLKTINETLIVCLVISFAGVSAIFIFYKPKTNTILNETANIENSEERAGKIMETIKYSESKLPKGIGESPTDKEIYSNPYIKHIRIALNGYLDGTNNGIGEGALDGQDGGDTNCGLNNFDKSYYKSKFIIYDVANNDYGGVQSDIVFVDKPDKIFWTWVYLNDDEEYVLRAFCENGPPNNHRDEFSSFIKNFIKESMFSI